MWLALISLSVECLSMHSSFRQAVPVHPRILSEEQVRVKVKREQVAHAFRNLRDSHHDVIDLASPSPSPKKPSTEAASSPSAKRSRTSEPSMPSNMAAGIPNPNFIGTVVQQQTFSFSGQCNREFWFPVKERDSLLVPTQTQRRTLLLSWHGCPVVSSLCHNRVCMAVPMH